MRTPRVVSVAPLVRAVALLALGGCHPAPRADVKPVPLPPPVVVAPPPPAPVVDPVLTPAQIAQRAVPSVALIKMPGGLGSGFVVAQDGRIATNLHVIRGAKQATVVLADGREFKDPEVLAADEEHDLALLRVPLSGLVPLPLGDSGAVSPGERVVAIGHPLGFGNTVTDGLVSAVRVVDKDLTVLQISAPISPGSSGGPLLDEHGRVIGVSTLMSTRGQNLNFGVPVAYLKPLLASEKAVPLAEWASGAAKRKSPPAERPLLTGCSPEQLAQIKTSIERVVAVGAPLCDDGNAEACFRIYEGAALGLEAELAGCPGPRMFVSAGLKRARDQRGWPDKADALRQMLDLLLRVVDGDRGKDDGDGSEPPRKLRKRTIPVHALSLLKGCSEDDLRATLAGMAQAISVGAPLYNHGNHDACFRIYEGAALDLSRRMTHCAGVRRALADGLRAAASARADDDKAWAMRDAFDGLINVIERRLDH